MKILVIQQKMIGDVLVSTLLCNNLRKAYPNAQIDYMVYKSTLPVLQGNNSINNFILFEKKHRKSKIAFFKLIFDVRKEKYDLIIDAYSKLESWLTVLFSNATTKISYKKLLNIFWKNIDPFDKYGQFCDKGSSYLSAIFPLNEDQSRQAHESYKDAQRQLASIQPFATKIINASTFYLAEDYHQDYYIKNPKRYKYYRWNCGRNKRLQSLWGDSFQKRRRMAPGKGGRVGEP